MPALMLRIALTLSLCLWSSAVRPVELEAGANADASQAFGLVAKKAVADAIDTISEAAARLKHSYLKDILGSEDTWYGETLLEEHRSHGVR
eukprot:4723751-Amphidinium_carterae.2